MWTTISSFDRTSLIPPESISLEQMISDPMSKASFDVFDAQSQLSIKTLQDVVILDETGLQNPAWNLLLNPSLLAASSANWFTSSGGGFGGTLSFSGSPPATCTITAGSGSAFGTFNQQLQKGLVQPGQKYILSGYIQINTPMTNAGATLSFAFYDGAGNVLSNIGITPVTTTGGATTRYNTDPSVGTAPAGAVYAIISFGVQQTGTSPNGTALFSTIQFEPMTFSGQGVSYPTPDCNPSQTSGPNQSYQLPNGTTIRGTRLFAGQLQQSKRVYDDASGQKGAGKDRTHECQAVSAEWILETTVLVNKSYSNMYDSAIIADLITTCLSVPPTGTGQTLPVPLFSTNNVVQGVLVDQISWDGQTAREALNALCNLSNFTFYPDPYFDLHYQPQHYNTTSFGLSDTPDNVSTFAYDELEVDEDGSQVRNRVQVNGGNYSQQQIDTFSGNGVATTFTLSQQPDAILSITVTGASQVFKPHGQGTLGVGGLQAQWDKTNSTITFNTAPPNATNNVVVTYTTPLPVRVRIWELQAIGQQNGRTYDAKIDDTSLMTPTSAIARGEAETSVFGYPRNIYTFSTLQPIQPGNVVPFTCQMENLTSYPLLIQKVTTTTPQGAGLYVYKVEGGAYNPLFSDILANLHKAVTRSKQVAGLLPLQEVLVSRDTLTLTESYSTH